VSYIQPRKLFLLTIKCIWLYDCLGLTLIANIQQHQYVTEVGTTAGLIVLVQPQNMMPFPEDRGKLVSPGYQTEFAITQVLWLFELSYVLR